ncbi:MAG TPA: TonB-dependent receptor, partial [Vicinamibacteria bacterium]
FGDARTRATDAKDLVSLTWARALPARSSLMARVNYGFSDYHGRFVLATSPRHPNDDSARGQWYGLEASAVRSVSGRHLVTAGVEFQDNFSQRQLNFDVEPRIVHHDSRSSSERLALFVQDEITVSKRLTLHVGLRQDWNSNFGYETSPRLALIYGAGQPTTLKLLYGRAFRAPNEFELHYTNPVFKANQELGPETIHTTEMVLERTLRGGVHLNASAYFNAIRGLISLAQDPEDGLFFFQNANRSNAVGLEAGLDLKRRDGPSGRLSYAWQRSREHASGHLLTNSPRHSAKALFTWPLLARRLTASADAFFLSSRRTLGGAQSGSSVVANVTLVAPHMGGRFELSASVYNLFDRRYGDPGSVELVQDVIAQDGRSFRIKVSGRF